MSDAYAEIKEQVTKLVDNLTGYAPDEKDSSIATFMDWLFIDTDYIRKPVKACREAERRKR